LPSYVTRAQLEDRFGPTEVAQAAWRDALDDDQVIAAAIAGAGELIDGYLLGGGYALPLDPVPALIGKIALDIAWYDLWRNAIPDDVATRYKDALKQLADIQSGRIALPNAAGAAIEPTASDNEVLFEEGSRTFTRDSMGGY
jgi:phage gp36-like protein